MARFYPLSVTEVRREPRDAVTLAPRAGDRAAFAFIQGQYLTFRRSFDGEEVRRCTSICAGRGEALPRVGIKARCPLPSGRVAANRHRPAGRERGEKRGVARVQRGSSC